MNKPRDVTLVTFSDIRVTWRDIPSTHAQDRSAFLECVGLRSCANASFPVSSLQSLDPRMRDPSAARRLSNDFSFLPASIGPIDQKITFIRSRNHTTTCCAPPKTLPQVMHQNASFCITFSFFSSSPDSLTDSAIRNADVHVGSVVGSNNRK